LSIPAANRKVMKARNQRRLANMMHSHGCVSLVWPRKRRSRIAPRRLRSQGNLGGKQGTFCDAAKLFFCWQFHIRALRMGVDPVQWAPRPKTPTACCSGLCGGMRRMLGQLMPCGGGPTIPLLKPKLVTGRDDVCDVTLRSLLVSARHCELALRDGYWFVRDLS